jgi:hypothetical protein
MPAHSGKAISPSLRRLDERACALIGYIEPPGIVRPASITELAAFVRDIREHKKICYSADEWQALLARVEASRAPSVLKSVIIGFLMFCSSRASGCP